MLLDVRTSRRVVIEFSFLTIPQRLKKFPKFYGTQRFITIFTRACRSVPILLHMNPVRGLHRRLDLVRGLFLEISQLKRKYSAY